MSPESVLGVDWSIQAKCENALRAYLVKLRDKYNLLLQKQLLWTCERRDTPGDPLTGW